MKDILLLIFIILYIAELIILLPIFFILQLITGEDLSYSWLTKWFHKYVEEYEKEKEK